MNCPADDFDDFPSSAFPTVTMLRLLEEARILARNDHPQGFIDEKLLFLPPPFGHQAVYEVGLLHVVDGSRRKLSCYVCVPRLGAISIPGVTPIYSSPDITWLAICIGDRILLADRLLRFDGDKRPKSRYGDEQVGPVLLIERVSLVLVTDILGTSPTRIAQIFAKFFPGDNPVEQIVSDASANKTVFISFGGADEEIAAAINKSLRSAGIKTWFFPEDGVFGDKLHRMMHDGVNSHDRVALLCSRSSLSRPGVLNELERVLELEARKGGADILIPLALDDYVFSEWAPARPDIAQQVRSRVIGRIPSPDQDPEGFKKMMERLRLALRNEPAAL